MGVLDRFRMDDKIAIVTGASSGLGRAFAIALAEAGADVVIAARRTDRLDETADRIRDTGRRVLAVRADVAVPADCDALVAAALEEFGRVDVLVNNAGVGTAVPATKETPEQFRQVYEVNVFGAYSMAQACGRVMQPGSTIVNMSSVVAERPGTLPQAAYGSSKAAVLALTRDLARQWTGRKGIRVNALVPGYFASEMTDQFPEGYMEGELTHAPLGRIGQPEELAAALVFLAGDACPYITGTALTVDGGLLVG